MQLGWNLDNSYGRLPGKLFSKQEPEQVPSPELIIFNDTLAQELGLDGQALKQGDGIAILAGNKLPDGSQPLAQAYAGHQFGHFTMLGDGRAVLLGEQITPKGQRFDIQLKGSGRTPYSRGGDGRAALGPMLREYIISEAMHALKIPTTRSLAVVTTGQPVYRETELPGAILTRVAASHIRVGTFEYAAQWGSIEDLKALADYTIQRHFPEVKQENPYLHLLKEVIKLQAGLIAQWQLVGFIHGVMNTDNMVLSGETIDYGPCAFMNEYDPETVFSSIDRRGRYAYGNQHHIGGWNLAVFAETLLPLLDENQEKAVELAQAAISEFPDLYKCNWLNGMGAKLGIFNPEPQDETLVQGLMDLMYQEKADFTNTFRALSTQELEDPFFSSPEFSMWQEQWQARLSRQQEPKAESLKLMLATNPAVIPRNHRVEEALASAGQEDFKVMERLLAVLADPFAHSTDQTDYTEPPPQSAKPNRTFCGT